MRSKVLFAFAIAALLTISFAGRSVASAHPAVKSVAQGAMRPLSIVGSCAQSPNEADCDDQDPSLAGNGCNTFSTMAAQSFNDLGTTWQVQMRYSGNCKSRWARLVNVSGNGVCIPNANLTVKRLVTDVFSTGFIQTHLCNGAYTNMVYAPADTSNNIWQVEVQAYDVSCGAHATYDYYPDSHINYPCFG